MLIDMWTSIVFFKNSAMEALKAGYDFGLQNFSDVPVYFEVIHNT